MQKRIMAFMKEHHMAEEGDCILAAVSGGADSVCLLLILQELAQAGKIRLCAVHVEHGIRGEDSRKDACFVEEICRQHRIPCKIFHCQAMEYARAHKMTVEEGARILRYGFFEQAAEIFRADRIAVAHNQNDCAETILFHLARGTGLKGLCGIPPVRDNIIRPLLCVKRREIEAFLAAEGQIFCQDKTNETLDYTRNRVRHQILPVLEEINSEAVAHMNQAAQQAAEAEALVRELTEERKDRYIRRDLQNVCISGKITEEKPVLQKSLLHKALAETAGSSRDISGRHVQSLRELFEKQTGRKLSFPCGVEGVRTYDGVELKKEQEISDEKSCAVWEAKETWILPPEGILKIPFRGYEIHTRILENNLQNEEIPKKMYTKWLDYDKIKGTMLLRTRREKDFLVIGPEGRRKKLKKFFIDEKIPGPKREHMLLLTDETHVVWVIGSRLGEDVKVTEDTRRILEIRVYGGNICE